MKQAGVSCLGIASGIVYHENLEDAAASGLLWNWNNFLSALNSAYTAATALSEHPSGVEDD